MLLYKEIIIVKKNFGKLLKKVRESKKMKVKTLSELSGVSQAQIHNLEMNKNKPNAITLAKLSKALEYDF